LNVSHLALKSKNNTTVTSSSRFRGMAEILDLVNKPRGLVRKFEGKVKCTKAFPPWTSGSLYAGVWEGIWQQPLKNMLLLRFQI